MNGRDIKSVFGIVLDNSEVLFLKRALSTSRPGQWGLPGGGVKPQERPAVACLREILEESNLSASVVRDIGVYSHSQYFLCSLEDSRSKLKLASRECSDYAWTTPKNCLSIGEIMDLGRLLPLFESLGLDIPNTPEGLSLNYPNT